MNGAGKVKLASKPFTTDEGPRADTSLQALAGLKAAFHARGTVTAGNSSQTSDGAAAAVVMSEERAAALGLEPMGSLLLPSPLRAACRRRWASAPSTPVPKALKLAGLTLDQIDLIELNEAFAAQSLAVIQQLHLDPAKVNVNGGAIALGHPLGCTGAKLTATLLHTMQSRGVRYGLVHHVCRRGHGRRRHLRMS